MGTNRERCSHHDTPTHVVLIIRIPSLSGAATKRLKSILKGFHLLLLQKLL